MFGKKKQKPQIDQEQLALIENAQRRVKQKKGLYVHFVVFLIGAVFLILANTVLGIGKDFTIFGLNWFVIAISVWLFFFLYHAFNVFITNKFMGKDWEKTQIEKLVAKQQEKIETLKKNLVSTTTETKIEPHKNLTIIVAAGENNEIGKNNALIWHLKDDLKRFKALTSGHHIIMGRKTFESFPKPLPNRTHVVISRQKDFIIFENVISFSADPPNTEPAKNQVIFRKMSSLHSLLGSTQLAIRTESYFFLDNCSRYNANPISFRTIW